MGIKTNANTMSKSTHTLIGRLIALLIWSMWGVAIWLGGWFWLLVPVSLVIYILAQNYWRGLDPEDPEKK
jgi:hypothetical protein